MLKVIFAFIVGGCACFLGIFDFISREIASGIFYISQGISFLIFGIHLLREYLGEKRKEEK